MSSGIIVVPAGSFTATDCDDCCGEEPGCDCECCVGENGFWTEYLLVVTGLHDQIAGCDCEHYNDTWILKWRGGCNWSTDLTGTTCTPGVPYWRMFCLSPGVWTIITAEGFSSFTSFSSLCAITEPVPLIGGTFGGTCVEETFDGTIEPGPDAEFIEC